jgi:hypothetical protein
MAQTNTYSIRCPQCSAQQDEILYDGVEVSSEPSLRRMLLENKLNLVTCSSCGHAFRVDKNMLYHDEAHGWMVYLHPARMEDHRQAEEEFRNVLDDLRAVLPDGRDLPAVDLVISRVELVERVFAREADLDPRVLEYVKYLIYTQNLDQFMPEEKALLLNAQECTEEHLCFVVQDLESRKLESVLQYKREAYDSLLEIHQQDREHSLVGQLFPGPYISARAYLVEDEV